MIIGGNKSEVIRNMKKASEDGDFNRKVEVDDPDLTLEEELELVRHYLEIHGSFGYKVCSTVARAIIDTATRLINRKTKIIGLEKLRDVPRGAVVTSNHFNPLDNTAVRYALKKAGCRRMFIVSQVTNLAMKGWVGFLMNYADIIPVMKAASYMSGPFPDRIAEELKRGRKVLIYPEREMWFNYRKPRTPRRGAYYYAAKNNVPLISLFVEIRSLEKQDNEEFRKVVYTVHVLDTIRPDPSKTVRENSFAMRDIDFRQKKACYEEAYGRKFTPEFEKGDIAGWTGDWEKILENGKNEEKR
ncbi:MAG: lysophospholipid acyltransferase family protein [Anaerovoracaceae bacterium]|jgi:1-acyl-sn-glycerol-3-phosphate acyltransferase